MKLYKLALHQYKGTNFNQFLDTIKQMVQDKDIKQKQLVSKLFFKIPNTDYGIPASTIKHIYKKHGTSLQDWIKLFSMLDKYESEVLSKKQQDFRGLNYLRKYKIHNQYFGVGVCDTRICKLITTFFKSTNKGITNWQEINKQVQPEAPSTSNGYGSLLSDEPNNIIPYKEEKINLLMEQKAYHGSNNEFDKFNPDKIKDYRYGWGFYFTRDKNYAQDYGNIKEYEIPEDEYLLDWENSYDYQSETVQDALYELWKDIRDKDTEQLFEKALFGDYCNNGYWIYNNLSEALQISTKETSLLMYKYGIKGIYSLEGNCFVIFNENDIKNTFAKLNEQLQKFLNTDNSIEQLNYFVEEAAMYASNKPTFEERVLLEDLPANYKFPTP